MPFSYSFLLVAKFEDILYKMVGKGGRWGGGRKFIEKVISKGRSSQWHYLSRRDAIVILGPSGGGKTTLLAALGGRLGGHLDGRITYNDEPFSNVMKRNSGFIAQNDMLNLNLTVTETLAYTALLRLSNTLTKLDKVYNACRNIDESARIDNIAANLKVEMQKMSHELASNDIDEQLGKWTTTWWQQFSVLHYRGLKERLREAFIFT
ncbi:hypothetical protein Sjap_000128 [Stephania japonica]|uniref:ABC transporter domain-containing protein n=1 Tax=Stephania japonica TaxID=461633 RepID=A0AAP0PQ39_9MAGN